MTVPFFHKHMFNERVIHDIRNRSLFGLFFYLTVPFCIFFTNGYYERHPQSTAWSLGIFISIIIVRIFYQIYSRKHHQKNKNIEYGIIFTSVLLTAIAWGLIAAIILNKEGEESTRLITLICTAGFCSGGVIAFIPDKRLSISYNLLILLPVIFFLLANGREFGLGIATILYSIYLISITIRGNAEYWTALESEERFKALHNASFGGITIHDKGKIVLSNQGLADITGYPVEELRGMDGLLLIAPESRDLVLNNILSGHEKAYEAQGIRKNGEIYPIRLEARNVPYKGRMLRTVEFRDITDQNENEAEREQLQKQLVQAQKMESIGRLAGGVAHDFNNMLSVIIGQTELIQAAIPSNSPIYGRLTEIHKAAERSADLTRHLLAFARQQTIAPKILNLNEAVAGTLRMIQRLIGEDIDLAWLPTPGHCPVKIDPSQLDQLLTNLCINARDAIAGPGKLTIETDTVAFDADYCETHPGYLPGEYVSLVISDNGCGIPPDTLAHIFEPFFTTKAVGKGTGLGLATVYGIVRQNDGFINVYSEVSKGTTFKIYLPRHQHGAESSTRNAIPKHTIKGNETILLVEDEQAILDVIATMVNNLGYNVLPVNSPKDAISIAESRSTPIDLLITDVVMPEMNGRQLTQILTDLFPRLKTLYMSGYTANVIAHHGVLDPGVSFIEKPFSSLDLAHKIRESLEDA